MIVWERVFADTLSYPCVCLSRFSHSQLFAIPWTVFHQAPLSTGILQARKLEWVAMPSSRASSRHRDQSESLPPALAGKFFPMSTSWEAPLISRSEHPGLSRHALCPMTGVLIRDKDMKMATGRWRQTGTMWPQVQESQEHQQLEEAGRITLWASRGSRACPRLDLRLLASRAGREQIPIAVSPRLACGHLS